MLRCIIQCSERRGEAGLSWGKAGRQQIRDNVEFILRRDIIRLVEIRLAISRQAAVHAFRRKGRSVRVASRIAAPEDFAAIIKAMARQSVCSAMSRTTKIASPIPK
jgi:hypothetical protein